MAITRLSGGTSPANGSDPRTFPAIWNDAVDDIEAAESAISTLQSDLTNLDIDDLADVTITTPADGEVLTYDDGTSEWVNQALPASGKILQVVSTVKTNTFTVTTTSFTDVDDLSVTITPSSTSSKIMVFASVQAASDANVGAGDAQIVRDSTPIFIGDADGSRRRASAGYASGNEKPESLNMIFLDSPNTTSATTYKVQVTADRASTAIFVNRQTANDDSILRGRYASSITVMEVAG